MNWWRLKTNVLIQNFQPNVSYSPFGKEILERKGKRGLVFACLPLNKDFFSPFEVVKRNEGEKTLKKSC
jgi:hypothetical protein